MSSGTIPAALPGPEMFTRTPVLDRAVTAVGSAAVSQQHPIEVFTSEDPNTYQAYTTRGDAMRLHTDVYLEQGFITPADLNEQGLYVDGYTDRSKYFYAVNGTKDAAARQIHCDKTGITSLPTLHHFSIDAQKLQEVAGVSSLARLKPADVVEISGLASQPKKGGKGGNLDAVMALYSNMLAESLEQGHKLWVLNVDSYFLRVLGGLVGPEQVHVLGEPKAYMGPATVPVALSPQELARKVLSSDDPNALRIQEHFLHAFQGISQQRMPKDIRELMDKTNMPTKRYSAIKSAATNRKLWLQAGIMAYSATRALPTVDVEQFHGSVPALWGIDVATSIPYTMGVIEAFSGKSKARKIGGTAVAATAFVAPYAYFYAEGDKYPPLVNYVVAGFVGAAAAKAFIGQRIDAAKNKRLSAALTAEH